MTQDALQPSLFDNLPQTVQPAVRKGATIQERFEAFDRDNPHVFNILRSLCLGMKAKGWERWSIKSAFEVARWQVAMHTTDTAFKLDNRYHSRYARKLMEECPELAGFFETRELKSD